MTMAQTRLEFSLETVRTDGWFERIGEGISAFSALCDILGERFFAFSIILGTRITSLVVDRHQPELSIVDFVVGEGEDADLEPQRLTLGDFRRRLVGALLVEDDAPPANLQRDSDTETVQLYIGVRYLLLAPLYGYSLRALVIESAVVTLEAVHDGEDVTLPLDQFQLRIRSLVREELERVTSSRRNAIDLAKVAEAETAFEKEEYAKVVSLLGTWPAALGIFLRTPEVQLLSADVRALIAKGLGLLGSACVRLGETEQAEEVFRIGIQYAQEGFAASDLFRRLGEALVVAERPGEAIGALRRALSFGGTPRDVMPLLVRALLGRGKYLAAYACIREALDAGVSERDLTESMNAIEAHLGQPLTTWKARIVELSGKAL